VLLLHGLCGHAEEWRETASWLTAEHRVLAPDARGHGRSERRPADVSRAAHVQDAAAWLTYFGLGPAAVVGQSLGGHTAFLLATRHPALVERLVVAEATPDPDPAAPLEVGAWLGAWPRPFPSRDAALAFFGEPPLRASAWADGLEERDGGLEPRFDPDVMVRSLAEGAEKASWAEWERVVCSTLVVRGERGVPAERARRMLETNPRACLVEIRDAGHDVHLEQPGRWREAVRPFLAVR